MKQTKKLYWEKKANDELIRMVKYIGRLQRRDITKGTFIECSEAIERCKVRHEAFLLNIAANS